MHWAVVIIWYLTRHLNLRFLPKKDRNQEKDTWILTSNSKKMKKHNFWIIVDSFHYKIKKQQREEAIKILYIVQRTEDNKHNWLNLRASILCSILNGNCWLSYCVLLYYQRHSTFYLSFILLNVDKGVLPCCCLIENFKMVLFLLY